MPIQSRPWSSQRPRPAICAIALLTVVTGCFGATTSPAPQETAAPAPATAQIDPSGRWCYADRRGRNRTDSIERVQGGIIIGPVGRKGREIFYSDAGLNAYRHGSGGAFQFLGNGQATWHLKDAKRSLRRCG